MGWEVVEGCDCVEEGVGHRDLERGGLAVDVEQFEDEVVGVFLYADYGALHKDVGFLLYFQ